MTEGDITLRIVKEDYIVKKARGKSKNLYLSELILAILIAGTGPKAAALIGISEQTFNRTIKKIYPNVSLNGGGQTWKSYLLHSVKVYQCINCGNYKEYLEFYKDKSRHTGVASACIKCRELNRNKIYHCEYTKQHYLDNKKYYIAKAAKYRANKLQRLPLWADLKAIEEFYFNCPLGYHVDHILPLNGTNVSGLHVIDNLQYLTAEDNLKKGNKFPII